MAKAPAKAPAKKALTKSGIITALADSTGMSKNDVTTMISHLTALIETELKKGAKQFTLPGIVRFGVKHVKAVKGAAMIEMVKPSVVNKLTGLVSDAILRHEPRVALDDLDVAQSREDAGVLRIRVEYRVLATNSRYNMVFPFYLNEATTPGR